MSDFKIKFKLYTDDDDNPQVKIGVPGTCDGHLTFWREEEQLSFLEVMSEDPDNHMEKLGPGVYYQSKL